MSSTQFKLTKHGGLTRRLTLPDRPTWLSLATRIEALFDVPFERVAVAYDDPDGDAVTLSSQDELLDFYNHVHNPGDAVKFEVIDLESMRSAKGDGSARGPASALGSARGMGGLDNGVGSNIGGATMLFEVDDDEWQHMPHIPNFGLFGMQDGDDESLGGPHAFVEVVESDANSMAKSRSKAGSVSTHTSQHAYSNQGGSKAREKEADTSSTSKSTTTINSKLTSEASIVEDDLPMKSPIHVPVYDFSDVHNLQPRSPYATTPTPRKAVPHMEELLIDPRFSAFGGGDKVSGNDVFDHQSESDSISTVTTTPESPLVVSGGSKPLPETPSQHSIPAFSSNTTPRPVQPPLSASEPAEDPPLEHTGEGDSRGISGPSFVNDVATLVEALGSAFNAHPEVREGLRNIVSNSVNGNYWASDRDRILDAANNVRRTADEMSENMTRSATDFARNANHEAERRIAETLGGIFRAIGAFTQGSNGNTTTPTASQTAGNGTASESREAGAPPMPGGWPNWYGDRHHGVYGPHAPPPPPPPPGFFGRRPHHAPPFYPPHFGGPADGFSSWFGYPPPPRSSSGNRATAVPSEDAHVQFEDTQTNPVSLRSNAGIPQRSNTWSGRRRGAGVGYEPTYLYDPPSGTEGHADVHDSKVQLEAAKSVYRAEKERFKREKEEHRKSRREAAERRAEEGVNRSSDEGREETVIARIPLPSPGKGKGKGRGAPSPRKPYAEIVSVTPERKVSGSGAGPSGNGSRPALSIPMLFDKVFIRLNDMGFTTDVYPNLLAVLNEQLYPNGEPTKLNEEQILAKTLGALHIRGTPSPRPSGAKPLV